MPGFFGARYVSDQILEIRSLAVANPARRSGWAVLRDRWTREEALRDFEEKRDVYLSLVAPAGPAHPP
jgi:hypothetical protein